jgi:hypothetical protein
MKIAILDDYFDTLRTLKCFEKLTPFDVTVFNDHVEDVDILAERLKNTEAWSTPTPWRAPHGGREPRTKEDKPGA